MAPEETLAPTHVDPDVLVGLNQLSRDAITRCRHKGCIRGHAPFRVIRQNLVNTPTHMLVGAALFARPNRPNAMLAAFAGGLVPDLPMFLMVLVAARFSGIPEHEVFGALYFSESWQRVFAIDHSFFVWTTLLAGGLLLRCPAVIAFAGAALAHAAVDFATHHDDARRQLWPFSNGVFQSPVSYWDPAHYGAIVGPIEAGIALALAALLLWRLDRWWARGLTLLVAGIQLIPILATGGFHGLHGMG